ncbi:unnamed protein product [Phyllotreta striolata]|uniref:28S ribosomal protein S14, mitochondrial n=1 Tax=Phyllotreta striolata TaxID=444603 RepID=A0A9N9TBA7_PHYSR|nr:unnamed protein product [Phyllotreta striolata]
MNVIKQFSSLLSTNALHNFQQIRNGNIWVNRWMIRDVKRRKMTVEYAPTRLRINTMRKNDVLPPELIEIADQEIAALPRDSALVRVKRRCVITSKPRSTLYRWRFSRIIFRDLADHNKLSGVQRAIW